MAIFGGFPVSSRRLLVLAALAACGYATYACSSDDGGGPDGSDALDGATDAAASDASDASPAEDGFDPCAPLVPDPTLASKRIACDFEAGAKVSATSDDPAAARAAIQTVIVFTHENRSFDHMYGTLQDAGTEGFPPSFANPTADGGVVHPFHLTTACPADQDHSAASIRSEWDNGKMDGFYKTDGIGTLGYYEPYDHPFYTWLLTTFATSDRYFCDRLDNTEYNRRFLYGASATATANNIFTELDAAKVDWADYSSFTYPDGGVAPLYNYFGGIPAAEAAHIHPFTDFYPALAAGTLPPVVYLDAGPDEHPAGSMLSGESIVYDVLSHAMSSPQWAHMAILLNYDEAGGFFDHVAPPAACLPSSSKADAVDDVYGLRVPFIVVSPFARKHYVSHVVHSHSSTLRFVELLHNLPALTARDANSDALLDLFDFACPDFTTPPTLPAKDPTGCALPDAGAN